METESNEVVVVTDSTADQLTKVVLGSIAGFIAGKMVAVAYDATKTYLRNR